MGPARYAGQVTALSPATPTAPDNEPGLFVTFEGGDGSGKSTQTARLTSALVSAGERVVRTREPGGTPLAETLRSLVLEHGNGPIDPRTEALLYATARSSHVDQVIRPALHRGDVVVCDRFVDSSLAYQGVGRGLGVEAIAGINAFATGGVRPHLTFLLDISAEAGRARRTAGRGQEERPRALRGAGRHAAAGRALHADLCSRRAAPAAVGRCTGGDLRGDSVSVWEDLPGQAHTVELLQRTAREGNPTHAWLFTGPPGSGRTNAARAFAAALECEQLNPEDRGCGECSACRTVLAGTHPDVTMVTTENVSYAIADVRELIGKAQDKPSTGRWRIIIVEDADRMTERTTNVLLKAIEEPPPHTVWILCAPSPADVLVTIRSRCRSVSLRVPDVASVTELLVRRDGLTPEQATFAARVSQGHIGVARRLARDEGARRRREELVSLPLHLNGLSRAMEAAAHFVEVTTAEADSGAQERAGADEAALRQQLGLGADEAIPAQLRSHFKQLTDSAKRRARRGTTDSLDRALIDLTTFFRDVLTVQLETGQELVNAHLGESIQRYAAGTTATFSLSCIDAIGQARVRIGGNVSAQLAIESLMTSLIATPNHRSSK